MARDKDKPKKPLWRRILRIVGIVVGMLAVAVAGLLIMLTIMEYRPANNEPAVILDEGNATAQLQPGAKIDIVTWNIGYGALGDNADFLLDGGTHMLTSSDERVASNMDAIVAELGSLDPDIIALQEVDRDSRRSAYIDEVAQVAAAFPGFSGYYATNYRTPLVPIGMPVYGKIEGGLLTLSSFAVEGAARESLPNSYDWPMSTVQLKRCQLVTRIPIAGTDRQLVFVNEHPDAYTDEEHHAAQIDGIRKLLLEEAGKGNYVIAAGDWNGRFSTVDSSAYPILDPDSWQPGSVDADDFGPGWQLVQDNSTPTCRLLDHPLVNDDGTPNGLPVQYYMIDGFIVSENVRVDSVATQDLGFKVSDHNPVLLRVTLL